MPRRSLVLATIAWIALSIAGLSAVWDHAGTPGVAAEVPDRWPASGTELPFERPQLLVFAHPRCPCTRATLRELARLTTSASGRLDVRVHFFVPRDATAEWRETDLWELARRIPNVLASPDPGGRLAAQFGVATSGQVLLFDRDGQLVFAGGLTPMRGHEGDSTGSAAIRAFLDAGRPHRADSPVYGCALSDPAVRGEGR